MEGRRLTVLFTRKQVEKAVKQIAAEIRRDYKGKAPLMVGVLKGSFIFMADLVREIALPVEIDFIKLSSYGSGTEPSGEIKVVQGLSTNIKGKHVLVVEDIADTGLTIGFLLDYLQKLEPASLKLCVLLDKPARRKSPVKIDYLGMTVPDKFIVGCGIDWDEKYRSLPDVCFIE